MKLSIPKGYLSSKDTNKSQIDLQHDEDSKTIPENLKTNIFNKLSNKIVNKIEKKIENKPKEIFPTVIDAHILLIPMNDPHNSEQINNQFNIIPSLTGFTGSNAFVILINYQKINTDIANQSIHEPASLRQAVNALFGGKHVIQTDSRQTVQVKSQVDHNVFNSFIYNEGHRAEDAVHDLIVTLQKIYTSSKFKIAFNQSVVTQTFFKHLKESIKYYLDAVEVYNQDTSKDLYELFWTDRPKYEQSEVFRVDEKYTGSSYAEKLVKLRSDYDTFRKHNKGELLLGVLLSDLSEIGWLLNLRGGDIEYNLLFQSQFYFDHESTILFIHPDRPRFDNVSSYLNSIGVAIREQNVLQQFLANKVLRGYKIQSTNIMQNTYTSIGKENYIKEPSTYHQDYIIKAAYYKSIKNRVELDGQMKSNLQDSAAIVRFLALLDKKIKNNEQINEFEASTLLESIRRQNPNYFKNSFETISAACANSSIIHYSPPKTGSSLIKKNCLQLLDTGGHYHNDYYGTTDITRTVAFSPALDDERTDYTYVLKSNIAIFQSYFPEQSKAEFMDFIARFELFKHKLDFPHALSHGIGHFSIVHEFPPQSVSEKLYANQNMSDEPGLQKEGKYGIRLEDDVQILNAGMNKQVNQEGNSKSWDKFVNMTMVPFDRNLIKAEMLSVEEKEQINTYHNTIVEKLRPILNELQDHEAIKYLDQHTQKI